MMSKILFKRRCPKKDCFLLLLDKVLYEKAAQNTANKMGRKKRYQNCPSKTIVKRN